LAGTIRRVRQRGEFLGAHQFLGNGGQLDYLPLETIDSF